MHFLQLKIRIRKIKNWAGRGLQLNRISCKLQQPTWQYGNFGVLLQVRRKRIICEVIDNNFRWWHCSHCNCGWESKSE